MPPKRAKHPVNQPIVNLLKDETESVQSENLKQTYRRAIRHVLLADFPITSKQDALRVRCVGEYIATKIDIFLRTARESNAMAAAAALARQQASMRNSHPSTTTQVPTDSHTSAQHTAQPIQENAPSTATVMIGSEDSRRKTGTSRGSARGGLQASSSRQGGARAARSRKPYTPRFRSGNFAFLLVLLDALDEGVNELSRAQVQSRAEKYCDEPVVNAKTADPATFYDAWSGMSTLIKKGLVAKHGSPAWYLLTITGVECAKICRRMDVEAANCAGSMSSPKVPGPKRHGEDDQERTGKAPLPRHVGVGTGTDAPKERVGASQSAGIGTASWGASGIQAGLHSEQFGALGETPTQFVEKVPRGSADACGHQPGGAFSDDRVHRAVIASERCEADGYAREECLDVLREIFDASEFPRSIDVLHSRMRDRLCQRKQVTLQGYTNVRSAVCSRKQRHESDLNGRLQSSVTAALPSVHPGVSQVAKNATTQLEPGAKSETSRLIEETIPRSESNTARTLSGHGRCDWGQSNADSSRYLDFEDLRPGHAPLQIADHMVCPLPRNPTSGGGQSSGSRHSGPVIHGLGSVIDLCEATSDQSPSPPSRKRPRSAISDSPTANRGGENESHKMSHLAIDGVNMVDDDVVTLAESSAAFPRKATTSKTNNVKQIAPMNDRPEEIARLPEKTQSALVSDGCQMECRIILILDTMERTQRNTKSIGEINTMQNMLLENGVKCEVRPLPCGDAMFISQFVDGTEVVLDYLIERKTVDDFAASMNDGRVAKQSYMMSQSQIERRMFVLEGDINGNLELREKPEYLQKLARLEVCDDFYVKRTKNLKETILFYSSMYTRLSKNFQGYPKSALLEGRALFPHWIARMKQLKNGITLEQLFALQLCQIRGVSTVTALAILKKGYNTPQALYRAFKSEPDLERRETLIADSEAGISTRTSRLLCKLFTATDYGTEILEET